MEKVRIGLIGAGLMGAAHSMMLRTIGQFDDLDVELVIACDPDAGRIEGFANGFGYREHATEPEDVFDHPEVDAVYICTPTRYHRELVEAAAAGGKHIFCEKPLAFTEAESQVMLDAARKASIKHQVGLVQRYSPTFHTIKNLIDDNDLGFPMASIFRDDQVFPVKGVHASPWRGQVEEAGAGTIIEHSIHDVDILTWLFGPIKSLEAEVSYLAGVKGIEDRAIVQFKFESGMTATLISLWHDVFKRPSNRLLEIFYERGYISFDEDFIGPVKYQFAKGNLSAISRDEVFDRYVKAQGLKDERARNLALSGYGFEDLAFVTALMEDRDPHPGLEVAVAAHRVVDAIYESARRRTSIEL